MTKKAEIISLKAFHTTSRYDFRANDIRPNNYGPIGDDQTVNSELMPNDEYRINKSAMDAVDKAKNMHDGGRRGGGIF